jgi:hypothetical protein
LALGRSGVELENGRPSGGSGVVEWRSLSSVALIGSSFSISSQDPLGVVGEALWAGDRLRTRRASHELEISASAGWIRSNECRSLAA